MKENEQSGFRLGSIGPISIFVEPSFLVLLGLFVVLDLDRKIPLRLALLWIPVVFLSVLLHELGHALMISLFKHGPSTITLSGFGGVTRNQRTSRPWQDILISLAGPLVSIGIALAAALLFRESAFIRRDPMLAAMLPILVWANRSWAIFNLLPIYPLDGGQVIRNFFLMITSPQRSFALSSVTSIILGVGLAILALVMRQIFVAVIAAMLVMQNYREWQVYRNWKKRPPSEQDPGGD